MHQLEWSTRATSDLKRLRAFLQEKNPRAASAAVDLLMLAARELQHFPSIGRPLSDDEPEHRELPVPFSNSGYVILYRFNGDVVEVLAVKHMREAGY
jgi:addiction module RelE/StbE family toxin